jgi:hypothetical protein
MDGLFVKGKIFGRFLSGFTGLNPTHLKICITGLLIGLNAMKPNMELDKSTT